MNKSLIAAMVLLLSASSQALAAGSCPSRGPNETLKAFRGRTHDFCQIKWQGLPGPPLGQTHDSYINICASDCYKAVGQSAGNAGSQFAGGQLSGLTTAGLATAGLVGVGVATTTDNGPPASP